MSLIKGEICFLALKRLVSFLLVNPNMVFSPPNEIYVQNVGDTVKLNCSAGGAPLPRVKWLRNGKRVYSTAVFHEHNLITSELVIRGFQPRNVAIYKCIFYNEKNVTAEASTSLGKFTEFTVQE